MTRLHYLAPATLVLLLLAACGASPGPQEQATPTEPAEQANYSDLGACSVELVASLLYGGIPVTAVTQADSAFWPEQLLAEDTRCSGSYFVDLAQVEALGSTPVPELEINFALIGGSQSRLDELDPLAQSAGFGNFTAVDTGVYSWDMDGSVELVAHLVSIEDVTIPAEYGTADDLIALRALPLLSAFE